MRIPIDRQSPVPLYAQVRDALRGLIGEGALGAGAELPASRTLAQTLDLNRGTVTAAYDELVAEGLLERHVGRGTFVAARERLEKRLGGRPAPARASETTRLRFPELFAHDPLRDRDPLMPEIARWAHRPGVLSFAAGQPDATLSPADEFRRHLNRALRDEGAQLLRYGTTAGHAPFVELLRRQLLERGIAASPEEILVVNGSQQGIDLVARLFLAPGDAIVVEDPSYPLALSIFRGLRARILPVPVDANGLDVEALARRLERERPKLLYTMPTFQNPTGSCQPLERRRRLLELCARAGVVVFEDDFKSDLRYEGEELPPLRGLPGGKDVVYAGTFSKVLFPGLRLGWLVAPSVVVERLAATKQAADLSSSLLFQAAMVRMCKGTALERHLERVRAEYRRRRDLLVRHLQKEMPEGVTWTRPSGGFSLLLRLPPGLDSAELLPRAATEGVIYTPGRVFSLSRDGRALRLSFGILKAHEIPEAVRRLARVVRSELERAKSWPETRAADAAAPAI